MASKKAQSKRKKERLKKKRALKQQRAALYASFKAAGKNKKSRRFKRGQMKKKLISDYDHLASACGNAGCEACNGVRFRPFLKKADKAEISHKPHKMPHRLYLKWEKLPVEEKLAEMRKKHLDFFRE